MNFQELKQTCVPLCLVNKEVYNGIANWDSSVSIVTGYGLDGWV
jgi:hypothetical protein